MIIIIIIRPKVGQAHVLFDELAPQESLWGTEKEGALVLDRKNSYQSLLDTQTLPLMVLINMHLLKKIKLKRVEKKVD